MEIAEKGTLCYDIPLILNPICQSPRQLFHLRIFLVSLSPTFFAVGEPRSGASQSADECAVLRENNDRDVARVPFRALRKDHNETNCIDKSLLHTV